MLNRGCITGLHEDRGGMSQWPNVGTSGQVRTHTHVVKALVMC